MSGLLYRLGAFGARRRRLVLLVWPLIIAAVVMLGITFAGSFQSSSSIPGSPAQAALVRMDQHFPDPAGQSADVVFQAPAGHTLREPALKQPLVAGLKAAGEVVGVTSVSNPFGADQVSPDGRTAVAQVQFSTPKDADVPAATLAALKATGADASRSGVRVVFGGDAYQTSAPVVGPTEALGLLVALLILVITFGSLLAAGMPLLTALVGVVVTLTGMIGLSSVFGISDNAPALAMMLALAVGIDYALFILSRHRTQLAAGMPIEQSVATATATAGSSVVFAGATVIIALCGLTVAGVPILTSMGLTAAAGVAVAVLMALGLLPALMAVAGRRLTPKPGSKADRRATSSTMNTFGVRWVGAVTRHPVRSAAAVIVGLLLLAAPATQLRLTLTDNGSDPAGSSSRQSYDLIARGFGPGTNGPLLVLAENGDPAALKATMATVSRDVAGLPDIAAISPVDTAKDGAAARIQITPASGPHDRATSTLVVALRERLAPIARSSGSYVAVTGLTAVSYDVASKLGAAMLPFGIVVIGLSLLLLTIAFRSIAVPLKATVGFLLSLGAAFGSTVAVFQWGWLAGLLGVSSVGPIAAFTPIIVMAVLFGLAMDYEVFLVSAMHEDYARTGDARGAVIRGARHVSRVVTAAALIMVAVFIGFVLGKDADIMPIAFALAIGVLVDAFLVRMTLVPAVLTLLGDRAWYLPRWLDRVLPDLDLEGGDLSTAQAPAVGSAADHEMLEPSSV